MNVFVKCNLGHGPFSHMFDALFIPTARPESHWKVSTTSRSIIKKQIASSLSKHVSSLDYFNHELAIGIL